MRRSIWFLVLAACGRADPGPLPGAASAELSSVTVAPSVRLPTDGLSSFAVAVAVRDNGGYALEGRTVELVVAGTADVRQPEATDAAGLAIGQVASRQAGDFTVVVVVDSGPNQVILATTPTVSFGVLALAYDFDTSGSTAYDRSSNGHNGAVTGATWTADGRHGGALEFDGADDEVEIDYSPSGFFRKAIFHERITVEAWVRPREIDRLQTVYQLGGEINGVALGISDLGLAWLVLRNSDATTPFVELRSPVALSVDTWTHLAATATATRVALYVDGVEVAHRADGFVLNTGTDGHMVGRHSNDCSGLLGPPCTSNGLFFNGTIDDLRVWEFGRGADEVLDDMERPAP